LGEEAAATIMSDNEPYGAFASRDYRYFFAARLANSFGTNIMMPALGWQIYALTRDPFALGMIGMAVFVPVVLSSLPAGEAADRLERRRVYQIAQLVLIVSALSFCALTLAHVTSPWAFYLGAALFGAAKTFSMPTATAWMPHLVPREHFPNAVVWTSSTYQISSVVGPAIVGVSLYAVGEVPTYALAAGCYLLSLVLARMVRTRSRGADVQQGGLARIFAGFTYISRSRLILGATTLDLFALFLGGATAMLPVYAYDVLHVGEAGFGLLRAAPALGSAATGILLAHRPLRRKVGRWMFVSVAAYGVTIIAFGLSRSLPLSLAMLVLLGAAETVGSFLRQTLVQLSTHDDMRGRVTSVNMMFVSARNELGDVQSGFAASLIGVVPAVVIGGVCTIIVAGVWQRLFPALRDVDTFEQAIPPRGAPAGYAPQRAPVDVTAALAVEDVLEARA
jgi:MFS family permease